VLVACSHGTGDVTGRRAVQELVAGLAVARPQVQVSEAFVDVQQPEVADVVRTVTDAGERAVVVPLLLSTGYHVEVDIRRAVQGRPAAAAPALGPDDTLAGLLHERLLDVGLTARDSVVLAAAGSSDPGAADAVEAVAETLRHTVSGAVTIGYAASARPTVAEAVARARREHPNRRVVVATYLLAPGYFFRVLGDAGADAVSQPLLRAGAAPDPRLVQLALARYDAAAARLGEQRTG
jgi:sirohydrochlorin ferrochelatase